MFTRNKAKKIRPLLSSLYCLVGVLATSAVDFFSSVKSSDIR